MVASSSELSDEKNEVVTTYQSLVQSPTASLPAASHSTVEFDTTPASDTTSDIEDAHRHTPSQSTLRRVVREYRVLEFGCTVLIYLVALVFSDIEVNERPIPRIKVRLNATAVAWSLDPSIDEQKLSEEVPMWLLLTLGIGLPVGTNITVNYVLPRLCQVRIIAHDTRDFLLSLFQSMALATFLTQFTKNITGRFRPSFYDMCKWNHDVVWDGVTNLCTDAAGEKEGRKSFPSGHASFSWASMLVLALYLLGRSRLNCENRSISTLRGGKKSLMLFMCCAPILLAAWISITRCIDNWHHYSDILAGSVIGAAAAVFAFSYNYGSIFSWESAGLPLEEIHERRMQKQDANRIDGRNELQQHSPLARRNFEDSCESQNKPTASHGDCVIDLSSRGSLSPAT